MERREPEEAAEEAAEEEEVVVGGAVGTRRVSCNVPLIIVIIPGIIRLVGASEVEGGRRWRGA